MEEATAHVREGRLDAAAEAYRRVLRYEPNEWIVLAHLGACERFLGRYDDAERVLRRALVVRPEEPGTLNELALVAAAAGRRGDAIAYLERATRSAPDFLQGWCNLGKLAYVHHMDTPPGVAAGVARARVVEIFDRILALDPAQAEFRFLREALTGADVAAPPEGYVAGFFDRFAAQFDERVAGRLKYSAPDVAARMLAPLLGSRRGLSVLDLGCGTGLSGVIVRAAAGRLRGVDVSDGMLARARAGGVYDQLECAEIADFLERQEPASEDLVLALDVFIYVGALDRVIPAISRVMRPGAGTIFSVEAFAADGYALGPSGRFAHSRKYVEGLAAQTGWRLLEARDFAVREEAGTSVPAVMFLYEKP